MPSNNNTPSSRKLRSNSQSELTLTFTNIKALIDSSKDEIISSFRSELQSLKDTVSLLSSRVDELEKECVTLRNERRVSSEASVNSSNFESFCSTVVGELQMRERRKLNIVIAGKSEMMSGSVAERRAADQEFCRTLFEFVGVSPGVIHELSRIGKLTYGRNRLLKVSLDTEETKRTILTGAKRLRQSDVYKGVFVKPDLTPFQQSLDFQLRKDLKAKIASNPGSDFVIHNGRVIERNASQGFQRDF